MVVCVLLLSLLTTQTIAPAFSLYADIFQMELVEIEKEAEEKNGKEKNGKEMLEDDFVPFQCDSYSSHVASILNRSTSQMVNFAACAEVLTPPPELS